MLKIGLMDEVVLNHELMIFTRKLINPIAKKYEIFEVAWRGGESI
jgi:hypothetical protein